jgi:hypothetical protein
MHAENSEAMSAISAIAYSYMQGFGPRFAHTTRPGQMDVLHLGRVIRPRSSCLRARDQQ